MPLWPVLLVCAAVAVWVDLGATHRRHQSDTLLPVLASLYYWTPFFWEQNRFGLLVPLLAMPVRHPVANLLVQSGLNIFAGLVTMFLLPRYVLRDATGFLVGGLSAASFLALAPVDYRHRYFLGDQPYAVSFALCLGGLLLAEAGGPAPLPRRRLGVALLLVVLAHWVNSATALLFVPLVVFRWTLRGGALRPAPDAVGHGQPRLAAWPAIARRVVAGEAGTALTLLGAGFAVGLALMLSTRFRTPASLLPLAQWPSGWRELAEKAWHALGLSTWMLTLGAAAAGGLLLLCLPAVRRRWALPWRAALALLGSAIAYWLVLGSLRWVGENSFAFRYVIPLVLLVQTALAVVAAAPVVAALGPRVRQACHALMPVLLVLAVVWSHGLPSLARVRVDLDEWLGLRTEDLVAARATHLAGGYWRVWPAVFHANLVLYERGEGRIIWGISYRSRPSRRVWGRVPLDTMRVAAVPNDPDAYRHLSEHGVPPLVVAEKRRTIWVLRPRAVVGASGAALEPYEPPAGAQ